MLSADLDIIVHDFKGKLWQRPGRRPGYDPAVQVIDAVMAGTDQQLSVFVIIHQTAQMGADPGEDYVTGGFMDDDCRGVAHQQIFRRPFRQFGQGNNDAGLLGGGFKKKEEAEQRIGQGSQGAQSQDGGQDFQKTPSVHFLLIILNVEKILTSFKNGGIDAAFILPGNEVLKQRLESISGYQTDAEPSRNVFQHSF
jgi:hypothetical protein